MKTFCSAAAILACTVLAMSTKAATYQDLDRVNDLVNQARQLANAARISGQSTAQPDVQSARTNPFSASIPGASLPGIGSDRNSVGVDSDQIRINAAGRQFVIPRITTGNASPAAINSGSARDDVQHALELARNYRGFAQALAAFKAGDYARARELLNQDSQNVPESAAIGPFFTLCLFANGDYAGAAELAYSFPRPLTWNQIRDFYGTINDYTAQYRRLEDSAREMPGNTTLQFLLGYHDLMLGHHDHAQREFRQVLQQLPEDPVVVQLLQSAEQAPPNPHR